MRGFGGVNSDWGITAVRLMMAIILIVAGFQKWANGIGGTVAFFTKLGLPLPGILGPYIGIQELVGGLLLLVGFQARWLGLLYVCEFLVTTFYVKMFNPQIGFDASRIDLMLLAGGV